MARGTAVIVSLLVLGLAPGVGAETLAASALRQNLFSSCFVNEQEGWVVGDLGRIFHTADGGSSWEVQDAGTKRPFVAVACPDENHVSVAGQGGQIAHSLDHGKTWQLQDSGTERQLLDIAFGSAARGIATGDYGLILRTEAGGKTWYTVPMPLDVKLPPDIAEVVQPGDVLLYKVVFADPDQVWIVGEFGVILHSEDGGQSWRPQESPVETTLFGAGFVDTRQGWAVGIESTLLHTTDGGQVWKRQKIKLPKDFVVPLGFSLSLYAVAVEGKYGWVVGDSGFLANTSDGGESWQLVRVPSLLRGTWFRGLSMLPGGHGYIVGARGMVLSTRRDAFTSLKRRD